MTNPDVQVLKARARAMLAEEVMKETRAQKGLKVFSHLMKSGPASREVALQAVLTPEEREVAKAMNEQQRKKKKAALPTPWRNAIARAIAR